MSSSLLALRGPRQTNLFDGPLFGVHYNLPLRDSGKLIDDLHDNGQDENETRLSSYFEHFQHFITVVVDDFHGDLARVGLVEWPTHRAVETAPCRFVDLRPERPPTLAEQAITLMEESLCRAEELLVEGRGREAVQETLWLLELVTTAFRGIETTTGTIAGTYFNQIVRELRKSYKGTTFDRVLDWADALHGYLSSPTGGGVRHGLDMNKGLPIGLNEARLFCNLVRSYLGYLLAEYEYLSRQQR